MATKIGINGFGRIGRCVARILAQDPAAKDIELVAVNDLTDAATLAHLFEFDSVHGRFGHSVSVDGDEIAYGDHRVKVLAQREPQKLPWKELGAQVVLECTGRFRTGEEAGQHLQAGAERVILSAPGKQVDATFNVGVNTDGYDPAKHKVVSNGSCTTNCLSPVAKTLNDTFGITKGHMVTVHSYTNDQQLLDLPHKDLRRARAAAMSMIPTSTGAAKTIGAVLPELDGKLDGTAIRVPTPNVSLICLSVVVGKSTSRDEVNGALEAAANGPLKGVMHYETRPLVSHDYIGSPFSSIVDADQTQVVGGDLVEVQAWYDNEWGFSQRMVDLTRLLVEKG